MSPLHTHTHPLHNMGPLSVATRVATQRDEGADFRTVALLITLCVCVYEEDVEGGRLVTCSMPAGIVHNPQDSCPSSSSMTSLNAERFCWVTRGRPASRGRLYTNTFDGGAHVSRGGGSSVAVVAAVVVVLVVVVVVVTRLPGLYSIGRIGKHNIEEKGRFINITFQLEEFTTKAAH